jgi:hypothetical protein
LIGAYRRAAGAQFLCIPRAGETTITLDGKPIPQAGIIALGLQGAITPA